MVISLKRKAPLTIMLILYRFLIKDGIGCMGKIGLYFVSLIMMCEVYNNILPVILFYIQLISTIEILKWKKSYNFENYLKTLIYIQMWF